MLFYVFRDPITGRITGISGGYIPGYETTPMTQQQIDDEFAAYTLLNSECAEYLKEYRDQKRLSASVEYEGITADASAGTQNALSDAIDYLLSKNDQDVTINWKGEDGFYDAKLEQLQGLKIAGGDVTQAVFYAERVVYEIQLVTPYLNRPLVAVAFDTAMDDYLGV